MPVFIFTLISTVLCVGFVWISIARLPYGVGWYIGQMALAGAAVLVGKLLFSIFHFLSRTSTGVV